MFSISWLSCFMLGLRVSLLTHRAWRRLDGVSNWVIVFSCYDLSPIPRQAITLTNAHIVLFTPYGTHFNDI